MKEYRQLGSYGIVIVDNKILLIKKAKGPYEGKLDLPGGTIEFGETPSEALKRELLEETGIVINDYKLLMTDSVFFDWQYKKDLTLKVHHVGIFYNIISFTEKIKSSVKLEGKNDDSLGAEFYEINKLEKKNLSNTAILVLEQLKKM